MNEADIAVSNVLIELGILSEESKEKICLIEDIIKASTLAGFEPPDWNGFCKLYDSTIPELELVQEIVSQEAEFKLFTKMFYHR
jgi:hypothetical protein